MNLNRSTELMNLLEIRKKVYRRNLIIFGTILLTSTFMMITSGLLFDFYQFRSFIIMLGINIVMVINYLIQWVKFYTTKENIFIIQSLIK